MRSYTLKITIDAATQRIEGTNIISFNALNRDIDSMQIDMQDSMHIYEVEWASDVVNGFFRKVNFWREGKVYWVVLPRTDWDRFGPNWTNGLKIEFGGKPRKAANAPWDGGVIWTKDSSGRPWIAVACQGLGASSWWPCKDYQGDEPEEGMIISLPVDAGGYPVSNGVSRDDTIAVENPITGKIEYKINSDAVLRWHVRNPINTYNVTFYIGDYIPWTDTLMGEKGKLDLSFHALRYNEARARKHFEVTKQMLHCFEYWMGPYPFYEDGYKLVEAPYLGMEHQSAVAYGNEYKMGYRGTDRSRTGVGMQFDYIIVHESGHEWFGNNITAQDPADNWLHEGFTTYTEALFVECAFGKEKAFQYTTGASANIRNDKPVIGEFGVNHEGSGDRYDKGSALVHMIRLIMNDDEKFRQLLRGLNRDFYHQIVTSAQVEEYISKFAGYDFAPLFNQYLRTRKIPKLKWRIRNKKLYYKFADAVEGFSLPLRVTSGTKS